MAAKKTFGGLGRGLGALLGDDVVESVAAQPQVKTEENIQPADAVQEIDIRLVDPNPDQPRKKFDENALQELSLSIQAVGVLQPIIVSKNGDRFSIIAGERRYRAARLAGLEKIPAIVREWSEQKRLEAALIENLQRDDLNPVEEAMGVRQLMEQTGLTQENAAARLGKSRPAVANLLRLLTLEKEVIQMLEEGQISAGHGRALVGLAPKRQIELARLTVQQGYSVRQLERICAQPQRVQQPKAVVRNSQLSTLEGMAREMFGTRVKLDGDENGGKMTLYYYSQDDLQRIWDVIEASQKL